MKYFLSFAPLCKGGVALAKILISVYSSARITISNIIFNFTKMK